MTPGPDFLVTTRTAMLHGRGAARRTVIGLAVGTAIWGLAGFFGIHSLFLVAPFLYVALKVFGGGYLVVLGLRLLLAGFRRDEPDRPAALPLRGGSAFRLGLITNLANPKAALFTTSLFAATLPPEPPAWLGLAAAAVMTTICLLWYGLVAQALTTGRVAVRFAQARRRIDQAAGAAFVGFGLHLALDSRAP